jgi:hypothetical protein
MMSKVLVPYESTGEPVQAKRRRRVWIGERGVDRLLRLCLVLGFPVGVEHIGLVRTAVAYAAAWVWFGTPR